MAAMTFKIWPWGKGNDTQMQRNLLLQGKHHFLVAALHF